MSYVWWLLEHLFPSCILFYTFPSVAQFSSLCSLGKSVDSLCAFSKGFVAGCDEGVLYVFERDEKEIYKQSKTFQIDNNYVKIKNLAISPSEDHVVCTLENNQVSSLSLIALRSYNSQFFPQPLLDRFLTFCLFA